MSQFVKNGDQKHKSHLIKATKDFSKQIDSYTIDPASKGVWGSKAKVICGSVTISSDNLDVEFDVKFDDDLESNEAEVVVYNLTDNTINRIKHGSSVSIEAGFDDDTGVVFVGIVDKVSTAYEGADKVTTIRCYDELVKDVDLEEETYTGESASAILEALLKKTGLPYTFTPRRDYSGYDEQKVDGSLIENIKKYSDVCGVSTFVKNGKIYSRHLKVGDNINFTVSEDTGMIGSPSPYEEEITAEDFKDTIHGYEVEMLLQHRMSAGVICNLKSAFASGQYRVRSGTHTYNNGECVTKVKLMGDCVTETIKDSGEA